jgi:methionine synthase II (cobalamin-independent)
MKQKILENGEEIEVSNEEILKLKEMKLIYFCPDCNLYHTEEDLSINDIENILKSNL